MTATAPVPTGPTPMGRLPWTKRLRHGWVLEVALVWLVWFTYDTLRDRVMGSPSAALANAAQLVDAERALGLYQELRVQDTFLDWAPFVSFWNVYYGTIHFVMPVVALVVMWRRAPPRYVRWRNTLVVLLGIGLLGFWLYPLAPPRLVSESGLVDTTAEYFNFGPQQAIALGPTGEPIGGARDAFGNLFAAMPSLHVGWSTWSALALFPLVRRRWLRVLLVLYPCATLFAIVVTGNHWLLDAVGGCVALGLAYGVATLWDRLRSPRLGQLARS